MWDYICSLCKHTVSSESSLYWIYYELRNGTAHLYESLMFRDGAGVAGAVNIKATLHSVITALFPLPFGGRTAAQVSYYTGTWCVVCFNPVVWFETTGLDKASTQTLNRPLSGVVFLSVISLPIFVSLWLESGKPAVAFWHDLRVNLCANDCRSWGKDAHSLSSHSVALSPSNPTISVLTRLSLADSRDIRQ